MTVGFFKNMKLQISCYFCLMRIITVYQYQNTKKKKLVDFCAHDLICNPANDCGILQKYEMTLGSCGFSLLLHDWQVSIGWTDQMFFLWLSQRVTLCEKTPSTHNLSIKQTDYQ